MSAPTCQNCGKPRAEHWLPDGLRAQPVCPTSTWKEAPPAGPRCHANNCPNTAKYGPDDKAVACWTHGGYWPEVKS